MSYVVKVGAAAPWEFQLLERRGAVDLTDAQSVVILMRLLGATDNKIDGAACTVLDATTGKVQYSPIPDDVDTAGEYGVQFTVTWSDGKKDKFPSEKLRKFFPLTMQEALD